MADGELLDSMDQGVFVSHDETGPAVRVRRLEDALPGGRFLQRSPGPRRGMERGGQDGQGGL